LRTLVREYGTLPQTAAFLGVGHTRLVAWTTLNWWRKCYRHYSDPPLWVYTKLFMALGKHYSKNLDIMKQAVILSNTPKMRKHK